MSIRDEFQAWIDGTDETAQADADPPQPIQPFAPRADISQGARGTAPHLSPAQQFADLLRNRF